MKVYQLTAKYDGELNCEHVTFSAEDETAADACARQWNRYHSNADWPGYGYQVAIEAPAGTEPVYDYMFKHQR